MENFRREVVSLLSESLYLQSLINDVKARRSERFDSEATSFIEVFLDKIECSQGDSETMFTRKWAYSEPLLYKRCESEYTFIYDTYFQTNNW